MKILITTDAYNNMINGVAISVKNLSTALQNAGNDVRILTLSQTHQSYRQDHVYFIRSMPLGIYPNIRASLAFHDSLIDEIEEWRPDIIHTQSEFFTLFFARKIAKKTHAPIVHTYHTLYEYYTHYFCPNQTLGKHIAASGSRFVCNRMNAVVAPTLKTKTLLERYGIHVPLHVIPTGLALEQFYQPFDWSVRQKLRTQLHIPEHAPVLVTLGRVAKEKNIDFLIQQMKSPLLQKLQAHFVIVGNGPDRERLEALVHKLGLCETVHFTGMVRPDEVMQYYRIGDVFVSASQSETQGLTYIEAMASGLPLLCRKDSCLESVLIPDKTGQFFEDEDSFVKHCMKIFSQKDILNSLSENALQKSIEFSKEEFAKRIFNLYENVLEDKEETQRCTRFVCIPKQI